MRVSPTVEGSTGTWRCRKCVKRDASQRHNSHAEHSSVVACTWGPRNTERTAMSSEEQGKCRVRYPNMTCSTLTSRWNETSLQRSGLKWKKKDVLFFKHFVHTRLIAVVQPSTHETFREVREYDVCQVFSCCVREFIFSFRYTVCDVSVLDKLKAMW